MDPRAKLWPPVLALACLLPALAPEPARAQDQSSTPTPETAAQDNRQLRAWTAAWNLLVWPAGSTLQSCFYLGERLHRRMVVDAADAWSGIANIRFDFGAAPGFRDCDAARPAALRVGFRPSLDSRSEIGTDALDTPDQRPTLFIGIGGVVDRSADEIKDAALHEIGHFLGLPHEHQHVASPCPGDFRVQAVCDNSDAFVGMRPAETAATLRMIRSEVRLRADPDPAAQPAYDPASIMHYRFPAHLLRGGPDSRCHATAARGLSDGDRAKMRVRYPAEPEDQHRFLQAEAAALGRAISAQAIGAATAERLARRAEQHVARRFGHLKLHITVDAAAPVTPPPTDELVMLSRDVALAAQCQPRAP